DLFANQVGITIIPTDNLTDLPPLLNLQDSFQRAVTMRPDLEQFRSAPAQRELGLKCDYEPLLPEVIAAASWRVTGLDPELSGAIRDVERKDLQQDSYGVFLRFPLTFRQERSNYRAARLDKARAILQLKAKEEEIVTAVDNAVREVQSAYERIG